MSRPKTIWAALLFLATVIASTPSAGADPDAGEVPPPEGASLEPASQERSGQAPFRLIPEDPNEWARRLRVPADSVIIERAGSVEEVAHLATTDEGTFIALDDLGRMTGGPFKWDPETWRGGFTVDSTEVLFVLDAPLVWIRGEVLQLPIPARYFRERVWLSAAAIGTVVVPLLGERARWDPAAGRIQLGGPRPWLEDLSLSDRGARVTFRLEPAGEEQVRLRWDPLGRLRVQVRGVYLPPGYGFTREEADGVEVMSVRGTGTGFEVVLRVDRRWPGVRGRHDDKGWTLEWTGREEEVENGQFRQLGEYLAPGWVEEETQVAPRRILLEVGQVEGDQELACLEQFATRLLEVLQTGFGHDVIRIPDRSRPGLLLRSPAGAPETAGIPPADLWVGLHLERWPSNAAREFLVVVPGMPAREQRIEVGAEAFTPGATRAAGVGGDAVGLLMGGALPVPWGQSARFHERASRSLARGLSEHLEGEWFGRPIRIQSRPLRVFRGLGVPAVLIYPTTLGDAEGIDALCDPGQVGALCRNIGFALDEFLRSLELEQ